ncbi:hypothetical protein, partial [Leptospira santarosai]|uniref:hypothetical protein n=1 Tax=Leptospira santarosai TaxID=28183 RepID=UPI001E4BD25F
PPFSKDSEFMYFNTANVNTKNISKYQKIQAKKLIRFCPRIGITITIWPRVQSVSAESVAYLEYREHQQSPRSRKSVCPKRGNV